MNNEPKGRFNDSQIKPSAVINEPGREGQPVQMNGYVKLDDLRELKDRMLVLETTIKNLKYLITILSIIFTLITLFAKSFQ